MANEIYICRHGATEWSRSGQHTGTTDLPLLPEGEEAARRLGARLQNIQFDNVLTSPLQRAAQTAHLAGFEGELEPALAEWDYGDYEGLTTPQIWEEEPHWSIFNQGAPGGESLHDVERRVDALLSKLAALEGRILLFSSGHISRSIGARWMGLPVSAGRHLDLSTASLSILGYVHDDRALLLWNDTSHLIG